MKSDFVKCGILGWCIEIIWTAFHGIKSKNNKFIGYTSIIMFPIYGLASVIKPISLKLKKMKMPTIIRGLVYSIGIFMVELQEVFLRKQIIVRGIIAIKSTT